jgi:hypothetical protein
MVDYKKHFPCGDCGKMVMVNEKHTYQDCLNWKKKLKHTKRDKR